MEKKNSRVTVYDIAKELGISPSTVTRALNNQTCISLETRTLVHKTAQRLGYRKNMLAHGLKAKPAKIGLILRNKFPEFQNLIVAGAKHACSSLMDLNASLEVAVLDDTEDYLSVDYPITPIDADVVIIDEMSMVDMFLMNHILIAKKGLFIA